MGLLIIAIIRFLDHPTEWHGIRAYKDFHDGIFQQYKTEMDERLEIYAAGDETEVKVKPLTYSPELIDFSNIDKNSTSWENKARAAYYGVKSIEIAE